jgi:hypothetical protein
MLRPTHRPVAHAAMLAQNVPFFEICFSRPTDAAFLLEGLQEAPAV